eukprot:TRINITY_DN795_c0_g1_i4.p1 TRINITY_DN795_c0_g1~~TRINITY_DN795_c0_g1_i4.p1  ORF type:complete len:919 (+),score=467.97 TRINITY_DN795_c0_g1_i4:45-2801(+)
MPARPAQKPDNGQADFRSDIQVVHLKPGFYTHVLDQNASATIMKVGPETFTKREHEQILCQPRPYIVIPPRHYCVIDNPVKRDAKGEPVLDAAGQAVIQLGEQEIRMDCLPFPLYPGESLSGNPKPLQVLEANTANRVKAARDFEETDSEGKVVKRIAGDEWLEEGPKTYYPHVCKEVMGTITAQFVQENEALKLRAVNTFVDRTGVERKVGSEWLWSQFGTYMPSVDETVVEVVGAEILSETRAIHVRCVNEFKDRFGVERKPGDVWLVTHKEAETYIATPNEEMLKQIQLLVLNRKQYCTLLDPYDATSKTNKNGVRKLIQGPTKFFLNPGERLEDGCAKDVHVLMADEALLLEALEAHTDSTGTRREAGDLWMISGPCEYTPPVELRVKERRRAMPMHAYEGVYIRCLKTGTVRAQMGPTSYMLQPEEELWEKELSPQIENLLTTCGTMTAHTRKKDNKNTMRDKTRVVIYSVPHNSVCQIFDYKKKTSRCVPGPDMVCLNPDEEFTVISLSGGKPKVPNVIKTLACFLGPDFMTDNIRVETADHARLELQLSYNWRFEVDQHDADECKKVFSVPDFVGDSCKAIASRIRGSCAGVSFDNFHKNSSSIIRHAVFGSKETLLSGGRPVEVGSTVSVGGTEVKVAKIDGMTLELADGRKVSDLEGVEVVAGGERAPVVAGKWPNSALIFPTNGLVINNVDIQSVEPVDQKTKDSLMKSVQLAIHITTQGQEAQAKQRATEEEQKARGELESQLIRDKASSEKERMELLRLKAESQAIETTGAQRAEAQAASEAAKVEAESMVLLAQKKAEAQKIQVMNEIDLENTKNECHLQQQRELDELEVEKARELATIESEKFKKTVTSIGKETIKAIAQAGPENQVRLLKALNLQGYMVTDGSSPINLFNTAQGMTGQALAMK